MGSQKKWTAVATRQVLRFTPSMRKRLALLVGTGLLLMFIALLVCDSLEDHRQGYAADREQVGRNLTTNDIPRLVERLCYEPSVRRMRLAQTLSRWPKPFSSLANRVYPNSPGERRQKLALIGFEILGPEAVAAVPRLATLLANTNMPKTAGYAAMALAHIGPEGLPSLTNALATADQRLRLEILWALANNPAFRTSPAGFALLTQCMNDPDPYTGSFAINAFIVGKPEMAEFIPTLTNALRSPYPAHRYAALQAFSRGYRAEGISAAPQIRALLNDSSPKVRLAASNAVANLETHGLTNAPAK